VRTRRSLIAAALAAVALVALAGACSDTEQAGSQAGCDEVVAEAAAAIETDEQLGLLDAGLLACGSYDAYRNALAANPGVIGYSPETYIELRCQHLTDPALRASPTCMTAHPPTTPPAATAPDIVYAAATLDGRIIELRPSDAVPFVGDVPAVVQETVDIASRDGCPGVLAQRDEWAGRAGAPAAPPGSAAPDALSATDIASVYAQHAVNVAAWIGCGATQTTVPAG
jgi:hypothetical protein